MTNWKRVFLTLGCIVLFGFLIFLAWEVLQTPFYDDITDDINVIVWYRVHCTLGDIAILLSSIGIVSVVRRQLRWMLRPSWSELVLVTLVGLAYTIFSEYLNVRIVERWAYSYRMPTVAGVGLVPMAQWILLPSLVLWLAARQAWGVQRDVGAG